MNVQSEEEESYYEEETEEDESASEDEISNNDSDSDYQTNSKSEVGVYKYTDNEEKDVIKNSMSKLSCFGIAS